MGRPTRGVEMGSDLEFVASSSSAAEQRLSDDSVESPVGHRDEGNPFVWLSGKPPHGDVFGPTGLLFSDVGEARHG